MGRRAIVTAGSPISRVRAEEDAHEIPVGAQRVVPWEAGESSIPEMAFASSFLIVSVVRVRPRSDRSDETAPMEARSL